MSIPGEDGFETPDDAPSTALGYMLEQGDHDIIIDLLRGMLAKRGMTGDEIDAALEGECVAWLRDQVEQWWEKCRHRRGREGEG
jgi:hypothetical protein